MIRSLRLFAGLVGLALVFAPGARAALDSSDSVAASLTVLGSASLALQPRNVSNNASASSLSFSLPAPGETLTLGNQYVEVAWSTNYDNWKIKTYTDNLQPSSPTDYWGALIGPDTAYRVYLRWQVKDDAVTPALNSGTWNNWTLVKDKADPDYDYNSGYINVAQGGTWDGGWAQLGDGSPCASPVNVYVAGTTNGLPPGVYRTSMVFDLLHL